MWKLIGKYESDYRNNSEGPKITITVNKFYEITSACLGDINCKSQIKVPSVLFDLPIDDQLTNAES